MLLREPAVRANFEENSRIALKYFTLDTIAQNLGNIIFSEIKNKREIGT